MAPIERNPSLPTVLLIGDSISVGYTLAVRERLAGAFNVERPPTKAVMSNEIADALPRWLFRPFDVIYFNCGLHDLSRTAAGGPTIPVGRYAENLERIVKALRMSAAVPIFATTTPIPPNTKNRSPGDEVAYNDAARAVMDSHGIAISDINALARTFEPDG